MSFYFFIFNILFFTTPIAFAQASNSQDVQGAATLGVAQMIQVKDKNIQDGSVLSANPQGGEALLSTIAYDPQVIGVVARDAGIMLNSGDVANSLPVISNGTVYILVSTQEGPIKKGDLLASSTMPGVAVKAVKSGYVLGTALEDDNNPDQKKVDKIAASLDLHYFNNKPVFPGSLTDIFKLALLPTKDSPHAIFKYVVAAIVVLGSFVLAFMTFSRTAAKGVEALGRNPAASKTIHLGIIFNVAIVVVIVLAGMTISFLILRL